MNVYRLVPHELIRMSLNFFNFPSKVGEIVMKYFRAVFIEFTVGNYTKWQAPEVNIMMGCMISPLLFMELLLQGVVDTAKRVMTKEQMVHPPSRAFIDDITVLVPSKVSANKLLHCYHKLFTWARMKAKLKKSWSLSLLGGQGDSLLHWW